MKDIQGYEGMYAVTSCGKVYSNQILLSAARVNIRLAAAITEDIRR